MAGPGADAWELILESDAWTYREQVVPAVEPDGSLAFAFDGEAPGTAGRRVRGTLRVGAPSGAPGLAEAIGQVRDAAVDVARELPRDPAKAAVGALGYAFGAARGLALLALDSLQGGPGAAGRIELVVVDARGARHSAPATLELDEPPTRLRAVLLSASAPGPAPPPPAGS